MALDTSRVPPTPAVLIDMLDESLATLEAAVAQYADRGETSLAAPVAVILRKLCHKTPSQTPLLEQLEQHGEPVPDFVDLSPGELTGFAIAFKLMGPNVESVAITSHLSASQAVSLPWRAWWQSNALCLPADRTTGWQAGRLSVARSRLAIEWANRYGGAHVDSGGPERWLIDVVTMHHLGYWTAELDEKGNPEADLVWFDQPRAPEKTWHSLEIQHRALGHLVLIRLAAEVTSSYGRPVPDMLVVPEHPVAGHPTAN